MAMVTLTASCRGQRVFSMEADDVRQALRSGATDFLQAIPLHELDQALDLGPGAAYYLGRHLLNLGLREGATRLFELEWKDFSSAHPLKNILPGSRKGRNPQAAEAACLELISLSRTAEDWPLEASLAQSLLSAFPESIQARFARLEGLVRSGAFAQALAFNAAAPWPPNREHSAAARFYLNLAEFKAQGGAGPEAQRALEDIRGLILSGKDPEALRVCAELILSHDQGLPLGERERLILRARRMVASRDYFDAALLFISAGNVISADSPAALLSDSGKAWLYGGRAREGSRFFGALADKLGPAAGESAALALLYAGRCLLSSGDKLGGRQALERCMRGSVTGPARDAAIWFLLEATPQFKDAARIVLSSAPSWHDFSYFEDVLLRLIREGVGLGEYGRLEELRGALADRLSESMRLRLDYVLARAEDLGLYKGDSSALDGLRPLARPSSILLDLSYYPIMEAYLGLRDVVFPPRSADIQGEGDQGASQVPGFGLRDDVAEELFLDGLIDYGLGAEFPAYARSRSASLGSEFLRSSAWRLRAAGRPIESARVMSQLLDRPGYQASLEDLEFFYPRLYLDEVRQAAAEFGLAESLLFAVVRTESYFDPRAVSRAGARGLAQLMPETAANAAKVLGIKDAELFDPETNLRLGAYYLRYLINYFEQDIMKAVLAYNGGMGRVRTWRREFPRATQDLFLEIVPLNETREYGRRVLAAQALYGYLYEARPIGETVSDFYPGIGPRKIKVVP